MILSGVSSPDLSVSLTMIGKDDRVFFWPDRGITDVNSTLARIYPSLALTASRRAASCLDCRTARSFLYHLTHIHALTASSFLNLCYLYLVGILNLRARRLLII